MGIITNELNRLLGKILARGTIVLGDEDETTPVIISNQAMGGPFIADDLNDLLEIPVERLVRGCKCTVNEHLSEGVLVPTTTYYLKSLPTTKLSVSGESYGIYWEIDRYVNNLEGSLEFQYADNYGGLRPTFLSKDISQAAYDAGYALEADYIASDTSKIIWGSSFDPLRHKWRRQKVSSISNWGMPVALEQSYTEGQYLDKRYQWKLATDGSPATPESTFDGKANNAPVGWSGGPEVPGGIAYEDYVNGTGGQLAHFLWEITALKDVYGQLLGNWSAPLKISTDPTLVRYGIDANNNDYLNDTYWRAYFTSEDIYRAYRKFVGDPWTVERISNESGEYADYVFKEFLMSYEPTLSDAPTTELGYGTGDWKDTTFQVSPGFVLYVSSSRKYSDGTLKVAWTIPTRFDGKSTTRAILVPEGENLFKRTSTGGSVVITPASLKVASTLYQGNLEVDPTLLTFRWFKGPALDPATGLVITANLIAAVGVGVEPNRNPQISLNTLEVFPENILNSQIISCETTYEGETYYDSITLYDVTDSVGYNALITGDGYIFKGEDDSKTYSVSIFEGGLDITDTATYTAFWKLGAAEEVSGNTFKVTGYNVNGIINLSLRVVLGATTLNRVETLTDVSDGVSTIRRFSAQEYLTDIHATPDTAGNPNDWSPETTNAVWAIDKDPNADWSAPYRIKGEKGEPSGGIQLTVYRVLVHGADPSWTTVSPTAQVGWGNPLVPTKWSAFIPTSGAALDKIYSSTALFLKSASGSQEVTTTNWTITGSWSAPAVNVYFPPPGEGGLPGVAGADGWSPKFEIRGFGSFQLLYLADWVGGSGTAPTSLGYVTTKGIATESGLQSISGLAEASNIRGAKGDSTEATLITQTKGLQILSKGDINDVDNYAAAITETSIYRVQGISKDKYYYWATTMVDKLPTYAVLENNQAMHRSAMVDLSFYYRLIGNTLMNATIILYSTSKPVPAISSPISHGSVSGVRNIRLCGANANVIFLDQRFLRSNNAGVSITRDPQGASGSYERRLGPASMPAVTQEMTMYHHSLLVTVPAMSNLYLNVLVGNLDNGNLTVYRPSIKYVLF